MGFHHACKDDKSGLNVGAGSFLIQKPGKYFFVGVFYLIAVFQIIMFHTERRNGKLKQIEGFFEGAALNILQGQK